MYVLVCVHVCVCLCLFVCVCVFVMECRLCQNYLRLPTQTTWMITLTIPRPKLEGSAPPVKDVRYTISDV